MPRSSRCSPALWCSACPVVATMPRRSTLVLATALLALATDAHRRDGPPFLQQALLEDHPASPAEAQVTLSIGLRLQNLPRLHAEWEARSTPGSRLFQSWLSAAEVRAMVANPAALARTLDFLSQRGLQINSTGAGDVQQQGSEDSVQVSADGMWVIVQTTAARAGKLFAADLREIAPNTHRAAHYTVPAELQAPDVVDLVIGLADVPPNTQAFRNGLASFGRRGAVQLAPNVIAPAPNAASAAAGTPAQPAPALPPLSPSPATAWNACCAPPCQCLNASAVDALYGVDPSATISHPGIATAGVFEVETYESYLPSDTATFQSLNRECT